MHLFHQLAVASSLALTVSARALLVIPPESALAELSKLARLPIGGAVTTAATATAADDDKHLLHAGPDAPEHHQLVKLDCPGCPFAHQNGDGSRTWDKGVPNALILDISVDNDNNEELKVNNVRLYGKEILPSPIRAPQVEASVSLADVRSAVEKAAAAADKDASPAALPYPVVGLGFKSEIREALDRPGQHADNHIALVTLSIQVQSVEKQKVHGVPTVHARLFKTAAGKLKIDRVDVEAAPAHDNEEDNDTTTNTPATPATPATRCTTLPVLCKWRALLLSRFRRVKTAVHHCIRCLCHRLRLGMFKIRLHGFPIHPHGHHHNHHHHMHHDEQPLQQQQQQHQHQDHHGVTTHNLFGAGSRPEPGSPAAKLLDMFAAHPAATAISTVDASATAGLATDNNHNNNNKHNKHHLAGLLGLSYASFVLVYLALAVSLAGLVAAVGYVSLRQCCRVRAAARRLRRDGNKGGAGGYVALPGPVFLEESGPFGLTARFAPASAAGTATVNDASAVDVEAKPFLPAYVEDGDDDEEEGATTEYRDEKKG